MGLLARWLNVVKPQNGGPRPKTVLFGLARTERQKENAQAILDAAIFQGKIVKYGERKDAAYGLPKPRRR